MQYNLKLRNVKRLFYICEQLFERQNWFCICEQAKLETTFAPYSRYDHSKFPKSWGELGYVSTSTVEPNIPVSKLIHCIWGIQLGVVYS